MNFKYIIYFPQILQNKIATWFLKKRFNKVGKNCRIQRGFDVEGEESISIGDNFIGGERIRLYAWNLSEKNNTDSKIKIGNDVCITEGCYLSAARQIIIKSGVLLGPNTFITDNFHGGNTYEEMQIPPLKRSVHIKGAVVIEKNVWIGRNVCIMPGVTIGEGAVIGANSVVTHDIPAFSIAGGVPARVIKENKEE